MQIENRYQRQASIVESSNLKKYTPLIIGVGAIGSQVATMLTQMGSDIVIVDDDTVGPENLCCQGFREADLTKNKVDALKERLVQFNSETNITTLFQRFKKSIGKEFLIIFCCVDTMRDRKFIFESVRDQCKFFVDSRTRGAAEIRVVVAERGVKKGDPSFLHYQNTLISDAEAAEGSCTAKTTIFAASCSAAMMVSHYTRWLKGYDAVCYDTMFNLTDMDSTYMVKDNDKRRN